MDGSVVEGTSELRSLYTTLFKKRTPTRGKFTRLFGQAQGLTMVPEPDVSKLKWYVNELTDVFMKLKALDTQMEEVIVEIGDHEEVNKFYKEKDERNENDSLRLHELSEFVKSKEQDVSTVEHGFSLLSKNLVEMVKVQERTIKSLERNVVGIKLPEIKLPKFDGNPLKWTEFWDLYKSTVHENPRISNAQKLAYLRNQLEDRALETVEGYKQVEVNYPVIIETLIKRFGKPRLIAKEHVKTLLKTPRVMDSSDFSALRKQLDRWEAHVRSLKEMNLDPMSSKIGNLTYLTVFEERIPTDILRRWEIKCHDKVEKEITLESFFKFLSTEVEATEVKVRAETSRTTTRFKVRPRTQDRLANPPNSTFASSCSGMVEEVECGFCDQRHHVELCCEDLLKMDSKELLNKKFWELEAVGISGEETKNYSPDEQFTIRHFKDTVKFENGRYVTTLPKSEKFPPTKTNYRQCKSRLEQIERKYKNLQVRRQAYQEAINKYASDGIAEEIIDDSNGDHKVVRYLPHHAVLKADSITTKTRIVFDASAQDEDGVSLNDCLLPGPALQPDLVSLLLRFRKNRVALMADIKKMFLQVVLDEEDQDLHRYLWRDFDVNAPIKEFRMLRLTFGINSSPFLAISVTRELATEHQKKYPVASKEIQTNMYVDDYLGGAQDSKSAVELYSELKDLMNEGGFDLTKWSSNSIEVLEVIPAEDRASMKTEDTANEPELLKALGITWNPKKDVFQFILTKKIDLKEVKTKKNTLRSYFKGF
ncbi:hypothetical protein QZH41_001990 [Actinostola sp. cb2023]|nr:hypothetical protein QZH41_001990 [Actinostola sp. cb2023]